jgi:ribonuclease HI
MIDIYTDGSSTGKANREGGWAFVAIEDDNVIYAKFGGEPKTTNNLQEIRAAIEALGWIIENNIKEKITIFSDSQYVIGIGRRVYTPLKNLESCELLVKLVDFTGATFEWVKGHGKNEWNNIADVLSKLGKSKYAKK